MNKMKKLIVCLCAIAALAGMDGNVANAAVKIKSDDVKIIGQDERGQISNLAFERFTQYDSYKNMIPELKKLINKEDKYFGILPPNHKDLIFVYRGPEYDIATVALRDHAIVWRTMATEESVLNPAIQPPKPVTYFNPTAATVKKLTPAEKEYVLAMRTALNESFNYVYATPFTLLKSADMKPEKAFGKLAIPPKMRPIAGTPEAAGLSELQVRAYDLFGGKPVLKYFPEPVKIDHPYSPCPVFSVMRVNGERIDGINVTNKKENKDVLIQRAATLAEVEGKQKMLADIRSGLERLPEEEMQSGTANSENLKQALTEMAQPAIAAVTILLDSKTFEKSDSDNWKSIEPKRGSLQAMMPFKSMMQQAERLAKNETDGKKVSTGTRFISVKPSTEMSRAQ